MKPSEKRTLLMRRAYSRLLAMRGICREGNGRDAEAMRASIDIQGAVDGHASLTDTEAATLKPVIDAWRDLAMIGNDDDDGSNPDAWYEAVLPLLAQLTEEKHLAAKGRYRDLTMSMEF
jgi:hypothetical protein